MVEKRKILRDLKKLGSKSSLSEFKELFDTIKLLNENMLFIQRNQCEQEAYLSLMAEKVGVDTKQIKKRIDTIQDEFND